MESRTSVVNCWHMTFQPGERFGRYELVSRLGHGGMAETWKARLLGEAGVTKPVLIKKVLPEFATDQAFTSMFISEARISATLSHGNIAQVYDFGRADGEYFLAMEYVDGQPLHRVIKRAIRAGMASIPIPLATFIALEMCRGLHYAHTRKDESGAALGIVHRDVSPDNVLISYEGQIKIVDFGIAKARELRGFSTEPGVVKGKFLFFSPEQAKGEEVDARTDVWATGVVLYEMVCGKLPIEGPQYVALSRLVNGEFPSPRQLNPDLPLELETIIMRALAVDRERRFDSCHAFENSLAGFLNTIAPRFSAVSLSYFVQELFRQDLGDEGKVVQVPRSFLEQLSLWRGDSLPTIPLTPAITQPSPTTRTSGTNTPQVTPPSLSPRSALIWGIGVGVGLSFLLLSVGFVFFKFYQPNTNEPSRPQPQVETNNTAAIPASDQTDNTQPQGPVDSAPVAQKSKDGSQVQDSPASETPPQDAVLSSPPAVKSIVKAVPYPEDETSLKPPAREAQPPQPPSTARTGASSPTVPANKVALGAQETTLSQPSSLRDKNPQRSGIIAPAKPPSATPIGESAVPSHAEARPSKPLSSEEPLRPSSDNPRVSEADTMLSEARQALKEKRFVQAIALSAKCIELTPKNPDCFLVSGDAHAGLNQGNKAVEQYRTFLRIAKGHKSYSRVTLDVSTWEARLEFDNALKLYNQKKYDQSLASAKLCLELDINNAECHMILGASYAYLGQAKNATEHYRIFLRLAPDHTHAPLVRQKLEKHEKQKNVSATPP
jgi:serine/threonine protein kinase